MFVGMNHSFAVPADEYGLRPNSIYYTDANTRLINPMDVRSPYHGDLDMGIFDYENKTLSPCPYYDYSSHDDQNLATPVWFIPSR
ncbi:hypothetical protein PHJA_001711700 [Phtheirospermum japonicum]|uniref:KIB1-4 beta-propeller domain-containing protein n=1 Tax=Phtheirospermum japonicum TaxID=374723 RepID=A0A830CKQ8_9LAMI|nr:hypothetical protein PHJA_001711700 [Phtheirospermum japonicum]